jgi:AmmeMemoRadiSam system protein B
MFYSADAATLKKTIGEFLRCAAPLHFAPKAIIVPHAGYDYSGCVAASAYVGLRNAAATITRVVLLGPSHRVPLRGMALSSAARFATPLGDVEIDTDVQQCLADFGQLRIDDSAHALEHSLEVQLPFLQSVLKSFRFVPIVVGQASPSAVNEALARLWGGPETLIVVSTDLSHYHDYATAKALDLATTQAIESRRSDIGPEQACGCMPLNGLLLYAKEHGLNVTTLDLRNSGDTAGPRDRVVGYGAYALQ